MTYYSSAMVLLLHGTLEVTIHGIDKLHTGIGFYACCENTGRPNKGKRVVADCRKTLLRALTLGGSNLYATVDFDKARVGRTRRISKHPSRPQWDESFRIYCAHEVSNIIFTVKDDNRVGATLIGRASTPVNSVIAEVPVDLWLEILDEDGYPIPGGSKIHVSLKFTSVVQDLNWSQGIGTPQFDGVRFTFFRQRQGCKVTLYKDAHVTDDMPLLRLPGGIYYEPQRCWEDIFDAINNARHIIYIAGWSVYTNVALVRDPMRLKPGMEQTLGQLLKRKAEEGVTVLMLVWDDRTSIQEIRKVGLMQTHDEETVDFFRNSKVRCVLCPRNPDDGKSIIQGLQISLMFTHHQKAIVVDSDAPGEGSEKRRIVSFIGGIDLCNGRYDTQTHPLFSTLNTVHRDDFHQPNFAGASIKKGGPREPWHDIHCRLEGSIAWDVLYNFEQRWHKQVGNMYTIPINKLREILIHPSAVTTLDDPNTWNVQLFRSIDAGAVVGFPENLEMAADVGLVSGKDCIIERSIQDAYINAIRRAKNFIYIENQYFLGSCYGWRSRDIRDEAIGALHLIPKELSLKIVSKIEAGERFAVYIVIPMWPEGSPNLWQNQAILDWQKRTMEMMYKDICQALQKKNLNADPKDYLTFFCLGNRESRKFGEYAPPLTPEKDSDYHDAQQSRRFMIYVHSKMMIVDDEYIIVGSANINQRSMDGARDSEIAMGAFQPHHIATNNPARGDIYSFRMALWYEHVREMHDIFQCPESLDCVKLVNQIAKDKWKEYSDETFEHDMSGHLMCYPIGVNNDGSITALPGMKFFPDTKAYVLGTKNMAFPPILTT